MGVFLEFLTRLQLPNLCPILPISSCRHLCHSQQPPPGPQGHLNQLVLQKFIQLLCLQQSLHLQKLMVCLSLCWTVQISFLDSCSFLIHTRSKLLPRILSPLLLEKGKRCRMGTCIVCLAHTFIICQWDPL